MTLENLKQIMKENGVVGAGGAGFPSYAKLDKKADTIILNCAECEPLLKLHRQVLAKYAFEIMSTLDIIAETVEADTVIIAVKKAYKEAVNAVKAHLDSFKRIKIGYLPEIYPAGDEVVTIYETTGRVVAPGKIPISVGVTVFNVETIYNVYRALNNLGPVTYKYITVAGEVNNPITVKVPLGTPIGEVIEMAGGAKIKDFRLVNGGPMTGMITDVYNTVTKTTNGILVMPKDHYIINKKLQDVKTDMKRAMSACCQCRMCTDLCSRNLLGHPIEPHKFMRAATSGDTKDIGPFINTMFCSACGICEMYACGQGLSPRTLISAYKSGLRKNGVKPPENVKFDEVSKQREFRKVPIPRLVARLGLKPYDVPAPLDDELRTVKNVKIALQQHIGAPAEAVVKKGDRVTAGQVIGKSSQDKLGVNIHSSVTGEVIDVNDKFVTIKA